MDFMSDSTTDGHRFRIRTLVDIFSRRGPGVIVERSIGGTRVVAFLDEVAAVHGYPESLNVDNGPEFISKALDQWAHAHGVTLYFSSPGKPVDNAFIESFNGRLRDECLDTNWFYGLQQAREVIDAWLKDHNEHRPHSSLAGLTPVEYEKQVRTSLTPSSGAARAVAACPGKRPWSVTPGGSRRQSCSAKTCAYDLPYG